MAIPPDSRGGGVIKSAPPWDRFDKISGRMSRGWKTLEPTRPSPGRVITEPSSPKLRDGPVIPSSYPILCNVG